MKRWLRTILLLGIVFLVGLSCGALLFSGVQPRSVLAFHRCNDTCLEPRELLGLVGSVVMQKVPGVLPRILLETDKTVVIDHPEPMSFIHYVAIPKKDIRNAFDVKEEDVPYLVDAYASLQYFIDKEKLMKYTISTNGPGYQEVDYLHFHLRAPKPR